MRTASALSSLLQRARTVVREEGMGATGLRFLQWLGVYRHLTILGGTPRRRPERAEIELHCERLCKEDLEDYLALRPEQSRATVEGRLGSGGICWVARHEGRIVGAMWVARGRAWVDYLGCEIVLPRDVSYQFDSYVAPVHRGLRVGAPLALARDADMAEIGCPRAVGLVWPENRAATRRSKRRRNVAVGTLRCFRVGSFRYIDVGFKDDASPPWFELAPRHRGLHRVRKRTSP